MLFLKLVSFVTFFNSLTRIDAYENCHPVHKREITKYQVLMTNMDPEISYLALTCDCFVNIDSLNQYSKMISLERKLKKVLKNNKLNWRDNLRILVFINNAKICQVYMKYEFMRKYLGYLF